MYKHIHMVYIYANYIKHLLNTFSTKLTPFTKLTSLKMSFGSPEFANFVCPGDNLLVVSPLLKQKKTKQVLFK